MKTLNRAKPIKLAPPMVLRAQTAADLMTPNPLSVRQEVLLTEAAAFLAVRGISAAPVIDEAGLPVGVVSRTDILGHWGQDGLYLAGSPEYYERLGRPEFAETIVEANRYTTVRDVMTPVVFCVDREAPAAKVVEKMLALEVRRLFVVDSDGILVGVVSAVDVLRKLRLWGHPSKGQPDG